MNWSYVAKDENGHARFSGTSPTFIDAIDWVSMRWSFALEARKKTIQTVEIFEATTKTGETGKHFTLTSLDDLLRLKKMESFL